MKRAMVNPGVCLNCTNCQVETMCERNAIFREGREQKPWVDFYQCSGCMKCKTICPGHAIEEISQPCNGKGRMGF